MSNTLSIKKLYPEGTQQLNNNSIFSTKCVEFSTKWWELSNFHNPTCAYKHPYHIYQKSIPSLQSTFTFLFLTIVTDILFLYTSPIFHLLIFAYSHPYILHQKHFPYLSHLANTGCVKGPLSKGVL